MSAKLDTESLKFLSKLLISLGAAWMLIMPFLGYFGLSAGGLVLFFLGIGIWIRIADLSWLRYTSIMNTGILLILISIVPFWVTKSWLKLPDAWNWPWVILNFIGFIMMVAGRILGK